MTQTNTHTQPKSTSFNSMGTDVKQEPLGCSTATNLATPYDHRCRSTCSIILSADLYPNEPEKAYGTYNTTASCTLSPDTVSQRREFYYFV